MRAILEGIKVLDFTRVLSGPTATRYLLEMGAEVVKVEAPTSGDLTRNSVTQKNGRSGYFATHNRGKRSICVNLKDERGVHLIRSITDEFDVIVENFTPGTMDRLGLGWEELSSTNPKLIMCSISGFGQTGPLSELPGYDGIAQAYAGIGSLNGELGGAPVPVGVPVGDVLTGTNATAGILGALFMREKTQRGQKIETSVLESYLQAHDTALQTWSVTEGQTIQTRNGRFHALVCPYGIFATENGYVFIAAAADNHWNDLCSAMDRTDLLDPQHRWQDRFTREAERDLVNPLVELWSSNLSRDQALERLQKHRVPSGPILSIDEVGNLPELRASGAIEVVSDPVLGTIVVPAFPIHFSGAETGHSFEAAFLGEHNEEILSNFIREPDSIASLTDSGVLFEEPISTRPSSQGVSSFATNKKGD
jgi:crotonobetainyl-CoA:carnitine CoA-transferase CaiB-like acyl-CoA transferase